MDPQHGLAAIVNADGPTADLEGAVTAVCDGGGPVGLTSGGELAGVVVPYGRWVQGLLAAEGGQLNFPRSG